MKMTKGLPVSKKSPKYVSVIIIKMKRRGS